MEEAYKDVVELWEMGEDNAAFNLEREVMEQFVAWVAEGEYTDEDLAQVAETVRRTVEG
jgi:hypothetical protein